MESQLDRYIKSGKPAILNLNVEAIANEPLHESGLYRVLLSDGVWSIQALVWQHSCSNNRLPSQDTPVQVTASAVATSPRVRHPHTPVAFIPVHECVWYDSTEKNQEGVFPGSSRAAASVGDRPSDSASDIKGSDDAEPDPYKLPTSFQPQAKGKRRGH
jgi:hypothetical protein